MAEGGVDESPPTYVLVETESLDGAFSPIRSSVRVKYTCFDVSNHYLVFGSTSGGIFLFHRENVSYIKTLPSKEGPVTQVALAPDDSILAFATNRGHVVVVEHNAEKEGSQPSRLQISYEHKGTLVTYLQWGSTTTRLYAGDVAGRVSVVHIAQSRTRSLFQIPSATLIKLESRIVQLDFAKDHLLISTHTRCVVYDTNKELWVQIGKKSREGDFGACFLPGTRFQDPCTVYAARPGSRLWEADLQGNVICTHQLKDALSIPSSNIVSFRYEYKSSSSQAIPQSVAFAHLFTLWPKCENMPFLLTWSQLGFYIFHPKRATVVLWNDEIKGIKSIRCYKNHLYFHHNKDCYTKLSILSVEQAATHLCQKKLYVHGSQLLLHHPSNHRKGLSLAILNDLIDRLSEIGHINLASRLTPLVSSLQLAVANIPVAKSSPQRARSVTSNWKQHNAQKAARCRSASPKLQSTSTRRISPRSSLVSRSSTPQKDRSSESETTSHSDSDSDQRRYFKPLPLESNRKLKETNGSHSKSTAKPLVKDLSNLNAVKFNFVNGTLSPVCEAKTEFSPDNPNFNVSENINELAEISNRSYSENSDQKKKNFSMTQSEQASMTDRLKNLENGMRSQKDKLVDGSALLRECPKEDGDLEFSSPYRLLGLSMYGGSLMLPPGFDLSLLHESDTTDVGGLDLSKLCDSISNTLTTGKKVILQNLRGLESKIKQIGTEPPQELLDVRPKYSSQVNEDDYRSFDIKSNSDLYGSETEWDFVPEIDISSLLDVTAFTKKQLGNPDILLDSAQCHGALEKWVNELHKFQTAALVSAKNSNSPTRIPNTNTDEPKHLTNEEEKTTRTFWTSQLGLGKLQLRDANVIVYEPFSLTAETKRDLSELAVLCLQAGILGTVEALSGHVSVLTPISTFEAFYQDQNCYLNEKTKSFALEESFPSLYEGISHVKGCSSIKSPQLEEMQFSNCILPMQDDADRKSALFLQNYYYLLKPEDSRRIFSEKRRYRSWCVLMKGLAVVHRTDRFSTKLNSNSLTDVCQWLSNADHSDPVVLAHLVQLASVNHQRAAEFCWKKCHQLTSQDVLYISRTMSCHPELFLTSLGMVLNSQKQTAFLDKIFDKLFRVEEVRWEWVWHILNQRLTQSVKCSCGAPRPGSHLYPWDYGEEILHIFKMFTPDKKYLSLCQKKGFWNGYLYLLKTTNQHEKHLQTVLQLGDAVLLSSSHSLGCLPDSRDSWKSLLLKIHGQQTHNSSTTCLSCSHSTPNSFPSPSSEEEPWRITLTLDRAVQKLLSIYKPRDVLLLLKELLLPPGVISSHVYQACMLTHVIDIQQSSMSLSMLARLESYMWSRRSTAIPSQIYRVFEREKKEPRKVDQLPSHDECRLQAYYLEEPENHWGTTTQLNQMCLLCGISLTSFISAEPSGVTVCSCGHSYHTACLPERLCILCLEQPCRNWE